MAEILHEFGRAGLTSTSLIRLAGTARNTFYDAFSGVEECLSFGVDVAERELFAALEGQGGDGDWLTEMHRAIDGFFSAVASRPLLAELFLIHSPSLRDKAGRASPLPRNGNFLPILRRGRTEIDAIEHGPPDLVDDYLSQGIISLAAWHVRNSKIEALPREAWSITVLVSGYYLTEKGRAERLDKLATAS